MGLKVEIIEFLTIEVIVFYFMDQTRPRIVLIDWRIKWFDSVIRSESLSYLHDHVTNQQTSVNQNSVANHHYDDSITDTHMNILAHW